MPQVKVQGEVVQRSVAVGVVAVFGVVLAVGLAIAASRGDVGGQEIGIALLVAVLLGVIVGGGLGLLVGGRLGSTTTHRRPF